MSDKPITRELFFATQKKAMDVAVAKCDVIRSELGRFLEELAVQAFGTPDPVTEPLFAPPKTPTRVKCLHCGAKYMSSAIVLEYRPQFQHVAVTMLGRNEIDILTPLWWCPDADCDGAGFGNDIHEFKPRTSKRRK